MPTLGRAARPRHRGLGPAGGRGLVRPALPEADGPDARVRPAAARDAPPRGPGHVPRRALPAAAPRRRAAREAAQADRAPAPRRHPDLPRRGRAEERRARDRLAAWMESPVTTLLAGTRDVAAVRLLAEAVL